MRLKIRTKIILSFFAPIIPLMIIVVIVSGYLLNNLFTEANINIIEWRQAWIAMIAGVVLYLVIFLVYILFIVRNITDFKKDEGASREEEEKFRTCIENMLDSFGIYSAVRDESGCITDFLIEYVNAAACENNRMSREAQIGRLLCELLPSHRTTGLFDEYCQVVETGKPLIKESFPYEDVYEGQLITRFFDIHVTKLGDGFTASWRDITEWKKTEEAFRTLVGIAMTNAGPDFFHETVRLLCIWLGVDCAIIGELVNGNRVQALAMQIDGKVVEQYEYALPGTPCNNVASKGYCEYPEGVCQLFPDDNNLVDMGAEAYVGIPIHDKNGKVNGILCAISRQKLVLPSVAKEAFLILAGRAGTEIERKNAEIKMMQKLDELERFQKVAVKREFRIRELQERVKELEERQGEGAIGRRGETENG